VRRTFCLCLLSWGLLVPVVAVSGAAAQTSSQPAASSQDIVQRDLLIAAQENLLNSYRCMFGVDAEAVPGGCGDPETVAPGPAPENPAQSDLEARDGLIRSQEALLNVYRCRFDIDTGLVPGGCPDHVDTEPADYAETEPADHADTEPADQPDQGDQTGARPDGQPDQAFTAVSGGYFHSCGIKDDNTITCWGVNAYGRAGAHGGPFAAISAGGLHTCGIRADSTAVCWGNNDDGQADAPGGAFTAISAGGLHTCGIRADRTAVCWGVNNDGQSDAPGGAFTAISAGQHHSCGIRADSTAVCWGDNEHGRADAPGGAFAAIAAGWEHSCGIRADRTPVCWGNNWARQSDAPGAAFR